MIVYRLLCRATGKSYIGATRQPLQKRLTAHRYRALSEGGIRSMYPLSVAIRDHGWEAFDVSILSHARSYAELQAMEKAAVVLFRTLHPHGYNQVPGGGPSLALPPGPTGKPAWNRGVTHSDKTKALFSRQRSGAKNARARVFAFQGVTYPCMQDCVIATGLTRNQLYRRLRRGEAEYLTAGFPGEYGAPHYHHTAETKQRMSAYRRAHHARRRAIVLDGQTYVSIISAVGVSGYTRDQIKKKLKRGQATYVDTSSTRET